MSTPYLPPGCTTLDKIEFNPQLRIGIQGFPKSGKTFAALTFNNPIVANFDRGLKTHFGRADVIEVPFYSDAFVEKYVKRKTPEYVDIRNGVKKQRPYNRRDALTSWLYTEGVNLERNQTLVLDGNTSIQAAFHAQYWTDPALDKDGKIKPYEEYAQKITFYTELAFCLKALKCDVVFICHESRDRNDQGDLNGKIRPLLSGAFKDELASHFTDWFRALVYDKPTNKAEITKLSLLLKCSEDYVQQLISESSPKSESLWLWQTESDAIAECSTSIPNCPKYITSGAATIRRLLTASIS